MNRLKYAAKTVTKKILGEVGYANLVRTVRCGNIMAVVEKPQTENKSPSGIKYSSESHFWAHEVNNIADWYSGNLPTLWGINAPNESEKIRVRSKKDSSILTWHKMCSEKKYLADLGLTSDALTGKRILDVGSGPISGVTAFRGCDIYLLDPLLHEYLRAGFPIHYYGAQYVHAHSEEMPLPDAYFDAVLSVNAIDHVDDFESTALEIKRVLKPGGQLAIHAHYHRPEVCEPIELSDERFSKAFGWCEGLKKISESTTKYGHVLDESGGSYAVWRNF